MKQKIAIVVPSHIPPSKAWVEALDDQAAIAHADVIIVDDSDGKLGKLPYKWRVYDYKAQQQILGDLYEDFARMFHKCSACRVFGHIVAYSEGYDVVIGLDSDCIVRDGFVEQHIRHLGEKSGRGWENPLMGTEFYSRGFPYHMRDWKVVAHMGVWDNVLDINGADRKKGEPTRVHPVVEGNYHIAAAPIPYSGMNFALTREAVPGFLFLPNFEYNATLNPNGGPLDLNKFRRIDDIWGGYIFQKLMQKRHESLTYGAPSVYHDTVVIAEEDAAEEAAMYKWEEMFIELVDFCVNESIKNCTGDTYGAMFYDFAKKFIEYSDTYPEFENLIPAMEWWVKVWEKYGKS